MKSSATFSRMQLATALAVVEAYCPEMCEALRRAISAAEEHERERKHAWGRVAAAQQAVADADAAYAALPCTMLPDPRRNELSAVIDAARGEAALARAEYHVRYVLPKK